MKEKFCLDLNLDDLTKWCEARGVPKYRASQIYGWLSSGCVNTDDMTNVPKNVRAMLEEDFIFGNFELREHLISKIDGTEKFVYALYDGNIIETVAMRYKQDGMHILRIGKDRIRQIADLRRDPGSGRGNAEDNRREDKKRCYHGYR